MGIAHVSVEVAIPSKGATSSSSSSSPSSSSSLATNLHANSNAEWSESACVPVTIGIDESVTNQWTPYDWTPGCTGRARELEEWLHANLALISDAPSVSPSLLPEVISITLEGLVDPFDLLRWHDADVLHLIVSRVRRCRPELLYDTTVVLGSLPMRTAVYNEMEQGEEEKGMEREGISDEDKRGTGHQVKGGEVGGAEARTQKGKELPVKYALSQVYSVVGTVDTVNVAAHHSGTVDTLVEEKGDTDHDDKGEDYAEGFWADVSSHEDSMSETSQAQDEGGKEDQSPGHDAYVEVTVAAHLVLNALVGVLAEAKLTPTELSREDLMSVCLLLLRSGRLHLPAARVCIRAFNKVREAAVGERERGPDNEIGDDDDNDDDEFKWTSWQDLLSIPSQGEQDECQR